MSAWRPQASILIVALVSLALGALLGRTWPVAPVAGRAPRVAATATAPARRTATPPAPAPAGTAADQALDRAMAAMDAAMMRVHLTGRPDIDFATLMIPHHGGAVAMAEVELLYGTDPRLRRLAQEIIVTQESEIAVMRYTLAHPHTPPSPAPH
jgi:uncharacterized protein (DUF305 family)